MSFTINCGDQIYFIQTNSSSLKWFRINDGDNVVSVQVKGQDLSPIGSRSTTYSSTVASTQNTAAGIAAPISSAPTHVVRTFGSPSKFALTAPSHSVDRYDVQIADAVICCTDDSDNSRNIADEEPAAPSLLDHLRLQKLRTQRFLGKMTAATNLILHKINSHSRSFKKKGKLHLLSRL